MTYFTQSDLHLLEFAVNRFGVDTKFTNTAFKNAIITERRKRISQEQIDKRINEIKKMGCEVLSDNLEWADGGFCIKYRHPRWHVWSYSRLDRSTLLPASSTFTERFKDLPSSWPEFAKFEKEEITLSDKTFKHIDRGDCEPYKEKYEAYMVKGGYEVIDEPFMSWRYVITLTPEVYSAIDRMKKEMQEEQEKKLNDKIIKCFERCKLSPEEFIEVVRKIVK